MIVILLTILQHTSDFSTSVHGRHNSAPDNIWYYLVLIISSIIVAGVVIWSIKFLFWPGEKSSSHIKRKILEEE